MNLTCSSRYLESRTVSYTMSKLSFCYGLSESLSSLSSTSLNEQMDAENCDWWDSEGMGDHNRPFLFFSDGQYSGPPGPLLACYQLVALAIKCAEHGKMLLSQLHSPAKFASGALWLPYVAVQEGYKYSAMPGLLAEFILKELNLPNDRDQLVTGRSELPFENVTLYSLTRIQLPNGLFITRLIFTAQWKKGPSFGAYCCKQTSTLRWEPLANIPVPGSQVVATTEPESKSGNSNKSTDSKKAQTELLARAWGSEVITFAGILRTPGQQAQKSAIMQVAEQTLAEVLKFVKCSEKSGKKAQRSLTSLLEGEENDENDEQSLQHSDSSSERIARYVADSGFTESVVIKLYSDFVQHAYPSQNMSALSFRDYCNKIGLTKSSFFTEAKLNQIFRAMNYRTKNFISFSEFLLGMVALHPDSPHSGPRHTFVFRFLDSRSRGELSVGDLNLMTSELKLKQQDMSELVVGEKRCSLEQFVQQIDSGRLKATSQLCRAPKSIIRLVQEAAVYDLIIGINPDRPFEAPPEATCPKCRPKRFTLATHTLKLSYGHRLSAPKTLMSNFDAADGTNSSLREQHTLLRQHSLEYIFNPTSVANYVLNIVRKLKGFNAMTEEKRREVRTEVTNALSINVLHSLCDQVRELFGSESRVLKVSSPTFVVGDLHGNINDLLIFETQLWPLAPACLARSVLFLGDYVDRGEFSIEVVCYLFAMKILAPSQFFMLRGNHEVRIIQKNFTFEKECNEKYGSKCEEVFEAFNKVFDVLPFAGIIDETIFCAHGGIPFTVQPIEDLNLQPLGIPEPEVTSPAVWEILWSDPITTPEFNELSEFMKKKDDSGFLSNTKRSTAFYFSEIATSNFLRLNRLSHVIRAHEVVNEGYKFNHGGKVITIFSCSRYCGGPNKAAAIMVEQEGEEGFIKIVMLDT